MARYAKPAKRANRSNPRQERGFGKRPDETTNEHSRPRSGRTVPQHQIEPPTQIKTKRIEIMPRNLAQEEYLDILSDTEKAIVFAMGPAGTGKTMLATQFAIKQLQEGTINKIVITRPAVSVDEQHGFLPGSLIEKMAPWVVPIIDVFKEIYSVAAVERMIKDEVIEISPLAFMRGRTVKNAIIIGDEMQNATPSQMKMLLTRIGDGSRMIVTGDLKQHDRGFEANGLRDFVDRFAQSGSNRIAVAEFSCADVERHPVIEEVLRIYGDE